MLPNHNSSSIFFIALPPCGRDVTIVFGGSQDKKRTIVSYNPFLFGANVHNVSKPGRENKNYNKKKNLIRDNACRGSRLACPMGFEPMTFRVGV